MRPLASVACVGFALVAGGLLCSADAQRGGGARGGAGSARGGGFSLGAHSSSAPSFHYSGGALLGSRGYGAVSIARPGFYSRRPVAPPVIRYRRPYAGFGVGIPYGSYGASGWVDGSYPGYYPDAPYYDAGVAAPEPPAGYDAQAMPDQGSPDQAPVPAEGAPRYSVLPHTQPPPPDEDAVTLIFKDGRAPLQIHNYALTRTMLYVRDQHHQDIPVDQLDLAATQKANLNSGVEFQLPVAAN